MDDVTKLKGGGSLGADFGFVIGVKCGGPDYYIAFMGICWSLEFDSLIYPALSLEEYTILGQV